MSARVPEAARAGVMLAVPGGQQTARHLPITPSPLHLPVPPSTLHISPPPADQPSPPLMPPRTFSPNSASAGAVLRALLKARLPRPPRPPLATSARWPARCTQTVVSWHAGDIAKASSPRRLTDVRCWHGARHVLCSCPLASRGMGTLPGRSSSKSGASSSAAPRVRTMVPGGTCSNSVPRGSSVFYAVACRQNGRRHKWQHEGRQTTGPPAPAAPWTWLDCHQQCHRQQVRTLTIKSLPAAPCMSLPWPGTPGSALRLEDMPRHVQQQAMQGTSCKLCWAGAPARQHCCAQRSSTALGTIP